jgi:hypothetical protein
VVRRTEIGFRFRHRVGGLITLCGDRFSARFGEKTKRRRWEERNRVGVAGSGRDEEEVSIKSGWALVSGTMGPTEMMSWTRDERFIYRSISLWPDHPSNQVCAS